MDVDALLPCPKTRNLTSGKDIISQLPDDVLLHIVNFLPTKDAIRTSVLSSRWRFLWPLMEDIHFDDEMIYSNMEGERNIAAEISMFGSVDKIFFLRGDSNLRKFHVSLMIPVSVLRVYRWVLSAVRLGVQELHLSLPPNVLFIMPTPLFNCKSLKNMTIEMSCVLRLPGSICLPCLKTLSLSYVSFQDIESVNRFLSGLPVLESLILQGCRWRNGDRISIQISSLRHLTIEYDSWISGFHNCWVKVYSANLVSFHCKSYLQFRICLYQVSSSLVSASLDLRCSDDSGLRHLYAKKILLAVRNVKHLILTNYTMLSLAPSEFHVPWIPSLRNLTCLEVESLKGAGPKDYRIGVALKNVLKQSPNLKSLRVDAGLCPWEDWLWVKLPRCFTNSSLETFHISNFKGNEAHTKLFTVFLRRCCTLKSLRIEMLPSERNQHDISRRIKEVLDRLSAHNVLILIM